MTDLPADHPFAADGTAGGLREALVARQHGGGPNLEHRVSVADAARRLIDELLSTTAPDATLAEAAALVQQANALLRGQPHGRPYDSFAESSISGDARGFLDNSPVAGALNPLAPPLRVEVEGDRVIGIATFSQAYEGPPGCIHGGFIAATFDEVLGFVQSFTGRPGMTGRLTVRYRSPSPLFRPVRFEGWVDRVEGRKIFTQATLHDGDTLTAEAEGLFISIDPEVFLRLMDQRLAGPSR